MQFLPETPVDQTNTATDDPAPSLHPHRAKQKLHHYYEPVRRRTPRRYSLPHEFSPFGTLPLPHPPRAGTHCLTSSARSADSLSPTTTGPDSIGARLPTFRARAADQAHVAY